MTKFRTEKCPTCGNITQHGMPNEELVELLKPIKKINNKSLKKKLCKILDKFGFTRGQIEKYLGINDEIYFEVTGRD